MDQIALLVLSCSNLPFTDYRLISSSRPGLNRSQSSGSRMVDNGSRPSSTGHYFPLQNLSPKPPTTKGKRNRPADIDTRAVHKRPAPPASPKDSNVGGLEKPLPFPQDNDLFPPMPGYESSTSRHIKALLYRPLSFLSSLCCLSILFVCATARAIRQVCEEKFLRVTGHDPDAGRPFLEEERVRAEARKNEEEAWRGKVDIEEAAGMDYVPTEGGKDPLVNDLAYYAGRVGLEVEELKVQTEDGFLLSLHHVFDPKECIAMSERQRAARGPEVFTDRGPSRPLDQSRMPKFPVLMVHGMLQSAGTFCSHDDNSLAFYLCKSGYDVWLGTNRCGFQPEHAFLKSTDPRMWTWTPRDMGTRDLPAFTSRVLAETGFEKLGFVAHSQGTTQTFIALSKGQRPDLGSRFTVFCALSPAVYAGPLLKRWYFSFIRSLSPLRYNLTFGIHGFIPLMVFMKKIIPGPLFGILGYRAFNYLFDWSDWNWDRGIRGRGFLCSPTFISSESMRWWLGRNGFAKNGCILASEEEVAAEEEADEAEDKMNSTSSSTPEPNSSHHSVRPWYDHRAPPMAFWAAGKDELVDGPRLINRFARGREPDVAVVHSETLEDYEHLDVIWAMSVIERVGERLRDVLWETCDVRDKCRTPKGCENLEAWRDPRKNQGVNKVD
ncbi:triacylglycerol lipase [Amylocarpus encephaloides]|uniref:Triacylglycerol lipase n=1 Tax=Amylocarpus encephaloides TaxID=45428 RepID=A0A9P7YR72_9HELO|nr:triacylglycerol lipase [Amylocarpus encephaloides]